MARTNKTGIDYFSFDVDFFQDEKVQFVSARFGMKGEIIIIRLLCKIYRNGYYTYWDDDTALLFAKGVGDGCQDSCVKDVVHELLKRGFFDKSIFERFCILTSRGLQRRYFEAVKRYKQVDIIRDFLLVDISKMENASITANNVNINNKNVSINSQKKRKEKKLKESKVKSISHTGAVAPVKNVKMEFWKILVDDWFVFYETKFSIKPSFAGAEQKALKSILTRLRKMNTDAEKEWTEDIARRSFHKFLNLAYNHPDGWLKANFLLPNLSNKYDTIVLPKNKMNGTNRNTFSENSQRNSGGATGGTSVDRIEALKKW
jgi:hypothetical protein